MNAPTRTRLRRLCLHVLAVAGGLLTAAGTARAQTPLADVLTFLLTNRGVPSGDFDRDAAAARASSETIGRDSSTASTRRSAPPSVQARASARSSPNAVSPLDRDA